MAHTGLGTGSASATSMNFVGFEDFQGQGAPELIYNQVFIEPNMAETAGVNSLAAVGFLPGQQSYIKRRKAIWSKSKLGQSLRQQGFRAVNL